MIHRRRRSCKVCETSDFSRCQTSQGALVSAMVRNGTFSPRSPQDQQCRKLGQRRPGTFSKQGLAPRAGGESDDEQWLSSESRDARCLCNTIATAPSIHVGHGEINPAPRFVGTVHSHPGKPFCHTFLRHRPELSRPPVGPQSHEPGDRFLYCQVSNVADCNLF
jgi:hypothetical protein